MAQRVRTVPAPPRFAGGSAEIEEYLDSKGLKWEFLGDIDPDKFDQERSLRNQARFQPLDETRSEEYAEAMRRGDKFPPVIGYGKREKIIMADGNHRLDGAIKAKKSLSTYFIIDADPGSLLAIMYERNAKHGLLTSEEERIHHALTLLDNGADIKTAAAMLSLPRRVLDKASAQRTADQRFREAGIPELTLEKLSETVKRRLAQIHTDEGFVPMVDLALSAKLSSGEVFDMVTQINELRSGAKQAQWVAAQREALADRIGDTAGGTFTRKQQGPKARVNMALTTVLNFDPDEAAKAYVGPEREDAVKRIREAARKLNALARALSA